MALAWEWLGPIERSGDGCRRPTPVASSTPPTEGDLVWLSPRRANSFSRQQPSSRAGPRVHPARANVLHGHPPAQDWAEPWSGRSCVSPPQRHHSTSSSHPAQSQIPTDPSSARCERSADAASAGVRYPRADAGQARARGGSCAASARPFSQARGQSHRGPGGRAHKRRCAKMGRLVGRASRDKEVRLCFLVFSSEPRLEHSPLPPSSLSVPRVASRLRYSNSPAPPLEFKDGFWYASKRAPPPGHGPPRGHQAPSGDSSLLGAHPAPSGPLARGVCRRVCESSLGYVRACAC